MEITHKIAALDTTREKLEQDLLKLQEDELELDDECTFPVPFCNHDFLFTRKLSGRCQGTVSIRTIIK
jgi:hypothetical protein